MGYCPSELKAGLGAGCWACWHWAHRQGVGGMGAQAWARGAQASARAERHGMARGACRQLGRRAHGRAQQGRGHGMDGQGRAEGAGRGARCGRLGGLCAPSVCS